MKKVHPLQVLKYRELRNLLTGRFFIVLAFRMLATLLGWWVYDLTKDPFAIGLIGLSEVLPAVTCSLYAGHVIDTREKKKLLLICNYSYVFFISLLLLPAFKNDILGFNNKQISYFIYGVIFFTGITRAFLSPIVPSIIPKVVSRKRLPQAITLNQGTFLTSSVCGHALGGLFIGLFGIANTLVIIVCTMLIASLFFLQINKHKPEVNNTTLPVWSSMKEGAQYIFKTKEILGAMLLDMFAVFFGGAVAMVPVFARDILHVDEKSFGLLNAASDLGAMVIIILLTIFPVQKNQGKILLLAVAGFGVCIIGFGISEIFWLSFILLVISGMLDGISVVIRGTIVQLKTPNHLRGRVLSVNTIFVMSSNEMGQFESGLAAKLLGPAKSVIFGGCMTLAVACFVGTQNKKLRNLNY